MRKHKKLRQQQEELLQQEVSSSYSDEEASFSGLYVFGEVVERTKRTLPNTTTEVVTYTKTTKAVVITLTNMCSLRNKNVDMIAEHMSKFPFL